MQSNDIQQKSYHGISVKIAKEQNTDLWCYWQLVCKYLQLLYFCKVPYINLRIFLALKHCQVKQYFRLRKNFQIKCDLYHNRYFLRKVTQDRAGAWNWNNDSILHIYQTDHLLSHSPQVTPGLCNVIRANCRSEILLKLDTELTDTMIFKPKGSEATISLSVNLSCWWPSSLEIILHVFLSK